MVINVAQQLQTSLEAAVFSRTCDLSVQDMEKLVCSITPAPSIVADSTCAQRVLATSDVVLMGNGTIAVIERHETSPVGPVDGSAAERHEISPPVGRVGGSAAIEKRHEMLPRFGPVDHLAAARHDSSRNVNADRHQVSGGHHTAGTWAAERHKIPPVGDSVATEKHQAWVPRFGPVDQLVAMCHESPRVSHHANRSGRRPLSGQGHAVDVWAALHRAGSRKRIDASAANRLEYLKQSVETCTSDSLAPGVARLEGDHAMDEIPATSGAGVSGFVAESELRNSDTASGIAQKCRSYELAAGSAPTFAMAGKAAETVKGCHSHVALDLGAGVDTGPGQMEGASCGYYSELETAQRCLKMDDWNDLLESDDPFGPLPSSWSSVKAQDVFILQDIAIGKPLMTEFLDGLRELDEEPAHILQSVVNSDESDLESVTTSQKMTDTEQEPVIFCGMARVSLDDVHSDSSDSEWRAQSSRQPDRSKGTSKHRVSPRAKENRQKLSSESRKINVKSFKRESSEIPDGGWFAS
ncbi:hypothetical protein GGX14DRAFT_400553 [Mycena pura]|uniref:Uncharacterized protein n=1 Tax=Mycena pura TaxID=153505 RepID=A0AAD6V5T0_9AGAR|nr:hypothetical protein GGX14DRAFT_400553 [Mycena pura]